MAVWKFPATPARPLPTRHQPGPRMAPSPQGTGIATPPRATGGWSGRPLMPSVTFQVLEGVDKGRVFRDLPTPVTIGREEGNMLRLNDERVSRFHAKIQHDNSEIILTDLDSTNGTRVNGTVVQIRRLKPGDRIGVGRSLLLFGSEAEIAARMATMQGLIPPAPADTTGVPPTLPAGNVTAHMDQDLDFDLDVT